MKSNESFVPAIFSRVVDPKVPLRDRIDLRRLRNAVDKRPFDMCQFVNNGLSFDDKLSQGGCGTTGCIGGNAVLNEFPLEQQTVGNFYRVMGEKAAARALNITPEEAGELFYLIFPDRNLLPPTDPMYRTVVLAAIQGWLIGKGVPIVGDWFQNDDEEDNEGYGSDNG